MNKGKRWTKEEESELALRLLRGEKVEEIAKALNRPYEGVRSKKEKLRLVKPKASKEPIDDIPSPVKPILSEKGGKKKPSKKAAAEEKITIDAQAFFALTNELSENAEAMEKLKTDNLELKTQLLNQSQLIAQQQDAIESLQIATEQLCDHITDAEDEANNKSDFMARRGLSRLFRRYKPLKRLGTEDPDMKEADNASNN